jgi:hypothetical protein
VERRKGGGGGRGVEAGANDLFFLDSTQVDTRLTPSTLTPFKTFRPTSCA